MLPYKPIYVDSFHQIHYLFENRLSDKFYFCIFTHVVYEFGKTSLQHWVPVNRDPGSTPVIYFLIGHQGAGIIRAISIEHKKLL